MDPSALIAVPRTPDLGPNRLWRPPLLDRRPMQNQELPDFGPAGAGATRAITVCEDVNRGRAFLLLAAAAPDQPWRGSATTARPMRRCSLWERPSRGLPRGSRPTHGTSSPRSKRSSVLLLTGLAEISTMPISSQIVCFWSIHALSRRPSTTTSGSEIRYRCLWAHPSEKSRAFNSQRPSLPANPEE